MNVIVLAQADSECNRKSVGYRANAMSQSRKEQPSLPVRRAFVVQFRAEAELEHSDFTGRVEHVLSGQATRFSSLEELLAFFVRVLGQKQWPRGP